MDYSQILSEAIEAAKLAKAAADWARGCAATLSGDVLLELMAREMDANESVWLADYDAVMFA